MNIPVLLSVCTPSCLLCGSGWTLIEISVSGCTTGFDANPAAESWRQYESFATRSGKLAMLRQLGVILKHPFEEESRAYIVEGAGFEDFT